MKPSTDLVMQALGDEDGFKLVEGLIAQGPQTQSALARAAEVSPQRAGEQLRLLQALGLVEREPAARGTWAVTLLAETAVVYAAAARLATSVTQARAGANAEDQARWQEFTEVEANGPERDEAQAT